MSNKLATMGTVADEAARLIKEQEGELPSARELSKATGFSVGTIYSHFGSLRGIIGYIVYRRQCAAIERLERILEAHDPKASVPLLLDEIIDSCFHTLTSFNPKLARKVIKIAMDEADRASDLDRVSDRLVPFIALAMTRDETGTFRAMPDDEILVSLRGMIAILRSPLLENSPFFATPGHRALAKNYLARMFLKQA